MTKQFILPLKLVLIALAVIIFGGGVQEQAFAVNYGQEGNGGGGVHRRGVSMTFYSAKLVIFPEDLEAHQIPNLNRLVDTIHRAEFFDTETKAKFIAAILPSLNRKYFEVLPDEFSQATYQRLIAEYSRLTEQPENQLILFAVTDTSSRETFLLPSFYQLTASEQQAILFHEGLWVEFPNAGYPAIVRAEMAMQGYLENPQDQDQVMELMEALDSVAGGKHQFYFDAAVAIDLMNPRMNGTLIKSGQPETRRTTSHRKKKNERQWLFGGKKEDQLEEQRPKSSHKYIDFVALFGNEFFTCYESGMTFQGCLPALISHLLDLKAAYPKSKIIDFFFSQASNNGIYLTALHKNTWWGPYFCDGRGVRGSWKSYTGNCNYNGFNLNDGETMAQVLRRSRLVLQPKDPVARETLGAVIPVFPTTDVYEFKLHFSPPPRRGW